MESRISRSSAMRAELERRGAEPQTEAAREPTAPPALVREGVERRNAARSVGVDHEGLVVLGPERDLRPIGRPLRVTALVQALRLTHALPARSERPIAVDPITSVHERDQVRSVALPGSICCAPGRSHTRGYDPTACRPATPPQRSAKPRPTRWRSLPRPRLPRVALRGRLISRYRSATHRKGPR